MFELFPCDVLRAVRTCRRNGPTSCDGLLGIKLNIGPTIMEALQKVTNAGISFLSLNLNSILCRITLLEPNSPRKERPLHYQKQGFAAITIHALSPASLSTAVV